MFWWGGVRARVCVFSFFVCFFSLGCIFLINFLNST